jgi:hypothetical protein
MRLTPNTAIRRAAGAALVALAALGAASCGKVARTGQSPAFLIIDALSAARGNDTGRFSGILLSDIETGGTSFNDVGQATFRLGLRNPGTPGSPTSPSTLNEITITRYRVVFRRSDGRNTQGVDVPYAFDGAFTVTVTGSGSVTGSFDLVRNQAKLEPPLRNLRGGGANLIISTIADITFFGRDQAGNESQVTGSISVNFADFGDPES